MPRRKKKTLVASLKNGDVLKAIINFCHKSRTMLDLFFEETGMSTTGRDAQNIAVYDVFIDADSFDTYKHTGDFHLLVDPKGLSRAMRISVPGDSIEIRAESTSSDEVLEPETFEMFFRNPGFTFACDVKCTDLGDEYENQQPIVVLKKPDCEITLPTRQLNRLAQDFKVLDDGTFKIECTRKDGVTFSAGVLNGAQGMMKLCETAAETDIRIRCKKDLEFNFALRMLQMLVLPPCVSKNVTMKVKTKSPLQIDYEIDSNSYVHFFLAPKNTELPDADGVQMED